ncbi:MAG: hypothetical protein H7257_00540 [Taibaiella sp.]|nr:hypothetical protein [Taibaiella sp.]
MRTIRYSVLAMALAFTTFIAAKAQTADEVIQKHITAIGGADNWKKIKSVKMQGTANAGGMEMPLSIAILDKKGMKVEYTINGMTGYSILTNKAGWNFNPFQGAKKAEALTDEMVKEGQTGLDIAGPLVDYKAKGNTVAFLGKDDVEGTECYKLKVTHPTGKSETIFIDAATYYHIRSVEKIKADGKEMEQISTFGNYKKLPEGIMWPMSIDMGGGGPMDVKSVDINKGVDEAMFVPKG